MTVFMSPSRNACRGWMKLFPAELTKSFSDDPNFCWVWPHFTKVLPTKYKENLLLNMNTFNYI